MGLTYEDALILTQLSKRVDGDTVVCLGQPKSHIIHETLLRYCRKLDINPSSFIQHWDKVDKIETREFFFALGFNNYHALDINDYEGADIVQDLSKDNLDQSHHNIADLVYDTGTLEHVYNVPNALTNIHKLLKVNGVAYHANPGNGYLDHGFYQISPTFYHDYYRENDYRIIGGALSDQSPDSRHHLRIWNYDEDVYRTKGHQFIAENRPRVNVHFCAQKTPDSSHSVAPVQSFYRQMHSDSAIDYTTVSNFDYKIKKPFFEHIGYLTAKRFGVLPTARRVYDIVSRR